VHHRERVRLRRVPMRCCRDQKPTKWPRLSSPLWPVDTRRCEEKRSSHGHGSVVSSRRQRLTKRRPQRRQRRPAPQASAPSPPRRHEQPVRSGLEGRRDTGQHDNRDVPLPALDLRDVGPVQPCFKGKLLRQTGGFTGTPLSEVRRQSCMLVIGPLTFRTIEILIRPATGP